MAEAESRMLGATIIFLVMFITCLIGLLRGEERAGGRALYRQVVPGGGGRGVQRPSRRLAVR
jgi:hypothetical protein